MAVDGEGDHAANLRRRNITYVSGVGKKIERWEIEKVRLSYKLINLCLHNFNVCISSNTCRL
jgi:hypothetical protein